MRKKIIEAYRYLLFCEYAYFFFFFLLNNVMSFYSSIRRLWYSIFYSRNVRSRRLISLFGIFFLSLILIIFKKKETCWRKLSLIIKIRYIYVYVSLVDYYRSRLFCFVLTNQENLDSRARAAYETWGHRCGRFVLITRLNSSRSYTIYDNGNQYIEEGQLPIQYIPTLPSENYSHLADKVRASLLFFNKYYPNYDWYLKADDDTYIIVENLLRFLISTIK